MTFEDAKVIGLGSIALLLLFVGVQAVRFDGWAILRRYVTVRMLESFPQSNEFEEESPATTTQQNGNNGIAMPTTSNNALLLQAKAEALATMVKAGKVGETEGIKLVFGVAASSSNPRYIAARAALKEELAKLEPQKFRRTPEQEAARVALGLDKHAA